MISLDSNMKQCILGISFQMGENNLNIFIKSARKFWEQDIVIIGDDLSDSSQRFLSGYDVIWDGGHERPAPFFRGRWKLYPPHLQDYDLALIADLRDVVFQGAPRLEPNLHVTEEEVPIWREGYNTEWVKGHGENVYEQIKDFPILCAGTVWGSTEDLISLCNMIDQTEGMDQGTLNVAVRKYVIPAVVHPNGEKVWTLGLYGYDWDKEIMPPIGFMFNDDKVLMPNGHMPMVIHQYDRHPHLVQHFNRIYG